MSKQRQWPPVWKTIHNQVIKSSADSFHQSAQELHLLSDHTLSPGGGEGGVNYFRIEAKRKREIERKKKKQYRNCTCVCLLAQEERLEACTHASTAGLWRNNFPFLLRWGECVCVYTSRLTQTGLIMGVECCWKGVSRYRKDWECHCLYNYNY